MIRKCYWLILKIRTDFIAIANSVLNWISGCLVSQIGSALDHRSLPPEFESWCRHIWRGFHHWLRFITLAGRSAHLAYHVHKSGRKTSTIFIVKTEFHIFICSWLFCSYWVVFMKMFSFLVICLENNDSFVTVLWLITWSLRILPSSVISLVAFCFLLFIFVLNCIESWRLTVYGDLYFLVLSSSCVDIRYIYVGVILAVFRPFR